MRAREKESKQKRTGARSANYGFSISHPCFLERSGGMRAPTALKEVLCQRTGDDGGGGGDDSCGLRLTPLTVYFTSPYLADQSDNSIDPGT
ncbi:unnamed protein product [Ectocarpus sp. CCAP 1310/34]|nr:unnamed protein product [Ectocarpus sp. CCAP 1310/34]